MLPPKYLAWVVVILSTYPVLFKDRDWASYLRIGPKRLSEPIQTIAFPKVFLARLKLDVPVSELLMSNCWQLHIVYPSSPYAARFTQSLKHKPILDPLSVNPRIKCVLWRNLQGRVSGEARGSTGHPSIDILYSQPWFQKFWRAYSLTPRRRAAVKSMVITMVAMKMLQGLLWHTLQNN